MKAIVQTRNCKISDDNALIQVDMETPVPGPNDLLVKVGGVSMNPVDYKVREFIPMSGDQRVLGYDAAGVVKGVGAEVTDWKVGDEVYYSGDFTRNGSNAEFQTVDARVVGRKPKSLPFHEAAAIPLTAITAWEILFDAFHLTEQGGEGQSLLVIGGAGGVGSILVQLAKKLTKLTVVATASRPDTVAWVKKMGADHVINHRNPLDKEMAALGLSPKYVAALTQTAGHWDAILELIKPKGYIAMLDDATGIDFSKMLTKSLSLTMELMFTRPMFKTEDILVQQTCLNRVADMVDSGDIVSTVYNHGGDMSVENLIKAHILQESGKSIGKTVMLGFP